jgi:hypothetical protein
MMMRALKAFDYNRRRLQPGDVFELQTASGLETVEAHRDVFLKAKMAEDIVEPPAPPKRRYSRRDMQAEDDDE